HLLDVRAPLCFVVDKEEAHRHFLSLALQSYGIETALFSKPHGLREGLSRRVPDLIFLDVSQASSETVESVKALAERSHRGPVRLMSDGAESVMAEQSGQLGQRSALRLLPALAKPIDRAAIRKVVRENQLDGSATVSGQISLDEALGNNWLEFWYQPKIDLR